MSNGQRRSLEATLLVDGALSATGLYLTRMVVRGVFSGVRAVTEWAMPASQQRFLPEYRVQRRFLSYAFEEGGTTPNARPFAMLARDPTLGGGLLLTPCGIFYVASPECQVYELRNGFEDNNTTLDGNTNAMVPAARTGMEWMRRQVKDWGRDLFFPAAASSPPPPAATAGVTRDALQLTLDQWIRLPPHAFFLYASALSWMPDRTTFNDPIVQLQANARLAHFGDECVLHMLLNDLFRLFANAPELLRAHQPALRRLLELLDPAPVSTFFEWTTTRLGALFRTPPSATTMRRSASQVLETMRAQHPQFMPALAALVPKRAPFFMREATTAERTCFVHLGIAFPCDYAREGWRIGLEPHGDTPMLKEEAHGLGTAKPTGQLVYFFARAQQQG
jgi:hypothetical protein